MSRPFCFAPDPERAGGLSRHIHQDLGNSLAHVCERMSGQMPLDVPAMETMIARLREGVRHPPAAFGHYYDLVQALLADRTNEAEASFAALAALEPARRQLSILSLDDPAITRHGDLYQRKMDTDPQVPFAMMAPATEAATAFAGRIEEAFELLRQAAPALAGEIDELVGEIVLAVPVPDLGITFDGGSPLMLWGAMLLNVNAHATRVDLAAALAHEAVHILLFALTVDEPLVIDREHKRYQSPLRKDPRPMDGIYHATFVAARLNWLMRQLSTCEPLSQGERELAAAAAANYATRFDAGLTTVRNHGALSDTGETVMAAAAEAMA